jgi:hypothetical protein
MTWTPDHPETLGQPQPVAGWGRAPLDARRSTVEGWWPRILKYRAALALAGDGQLTVGLAQLYTRAALFAGDGGLEVVTDGGNRPPLDGLTIWTALGFSRPLDLAGVGGLTMTTTAKPTIPVPFAGVGALSIATQAQTTAALALSGDGGLTITPTIPTFDPVTAVITINGSYQIPWWANRLEVVVLGGGGGGCQGKLLQTGQGGTAGKFGTAIYTRGVNIPWSTTSLSCSVGARGPAASNASQPNPAGNGGASSVSGTGIATVTGAGGLGGANSGSVNGQGAGSVSLGGITYTGGDTAQGLLGQSSNAPGGAGIGGGVGNGAGGPGALGQIWIRAVQ